MACNIKILKTGFSFKQNIYNIANSTCTLVQGKHNIIIDCLSAWDKDFLISELTAVNLSPEDIHYVIGTHCHPDHIGNLNLFLNAKHIIGFSIQFGNEFEEHSFDNGTILNINDDVGVIATPGHTNEDISVIINTEHYGVTVAAGDLFEKEEDIENPTIWKNAGSVDCKQQMKNRLLIINMANYIIPGHGPIFKVKDSYKNLLEQQVKNFM